MKVKQRRTHSSRSLFILVSVIFAIFFHQARISLFISYIVLVVSFAIGLAFFIKDSRRFNLPLILNGNFLTLLSLFLIFIIAPLARVKLMTELPAVFALRDWQTSYPKVNILVCVAIFALISGSSISRENPSALNLQLEPLNINMRKAQNFSSFLILILAVYFLNWVRSQGFIFEVLFGSRARKRSIGIDYSNGYALETLYAIFGIMSFWYFIAVLRQYRSKYVLLVVSGALLTPALFTGNRYAVIYYGLVLVLINFGKTRLVNRKIAIFLIILLPLIVVIPREARDSVVGLNTQTGSQLFTKNAFLKTFTGNDLAMAPAFSILIGSESPRLNGSTYIGMLVKPIPRNLWPSKPIPIDTQMMFRLFPEVAPYTGFAFSALSEPYLNFGPMGVVLFFLLLGKLNSRLFKGASKKGGIYIYLNAWISAFMIYLMRGNLSMDIQRCAFPLIISLLPFLIFQKKKESQVKNRDLISD